MIDLDGSYDGAIPVPLLNNKDVSNTYGIASVADHMQTHVTSPDLLCSAMPEYLFYAFDTINNLSSAGADSCLLFRRGYKHIFDYLNTYKCSRSTTQYTEGLVASGAKDSRSC
jgi:hypothetical protein